MLEEQAELFLQLCPGNVCVQCGICEACGRAIGGPVHLEVCACPDSSFHFVCLKCTESNGD